MANLDKTIRDFAKTMQNNGKPKTTPYDTPAEVVRTEGDIVWVRIPGGVDETPVKKTIDAKKGDTVQVRVSGGTAYLIGNASSPPTDDTTANIAHDIAVDADAKAVNAQKTADDIVQHFWADDDGAHITEVTQNEYIRDPENSGGNTLITSDGMFIREGTKEVAEFTNSGARIGELDSGNVEITSDGFSINNQSIQLATFNSDGIILKTQEGNDALTIEGAGDSVEKIIKKMLAKRCTALNKDELILYGRTKTCTFELGTTFPTNKTLTIRISELSHNSAYSGFSSQTITYGTEKQVSSGSWAYGTYKIYIGWNSEIGVYAKSTVTQTVQGKAQVSPYTYNFAIAYITYTSTVYLPSLTTDGNISAYRNKTLAGGIIGSFIRISGEDNATQTCLSDYRTLNLKTVGINRGNAFEIVRIGSDTPQRWGIKCLYPGTLLVGGKVTYTSGFTANDITYTQPYNYTTSTPIGGAYRHRTTTTNASITVSVPSTPTAVSANDVIVMRAQNATGARGTVTLEASMLFAMYMGPLLNV